MTGNIRGLQDQEMKKSNFLLSVHSSERLTERTAAGRKGNDKIFRAFETHKEINSQVVN